MKKLITIAILGVASLCAADKKPDKPAASPKVTVIPKDAVKNADGTYSYTDKDGKKWIYTNSPFGVIKSSGDSQPAPAAPAVATKAIDKGDTVRFERPTPFGTKTWEKKKSELTDEERSIVDAQTPTASPDAK